jgi:hypothetical protein
MSKDQGILVLKQVIYVVTTVLKRVKEQLVVNDE